MRKRAAFYSAKGSEINLNAAGEPRTAERSREAEGQERLASREPGRSNCQFVEWSISPQSSLDVCSDSGYILARMRYEIILAPEAVEDLRSLKANVRSAVRDAIERHLRYAPTRTSKSRIKKLRGISRPQFRLRVDEVRVFYDVTERVVEVLAIVHKSEAQS